MLTTFLVSLVLVTPGSCRPDDIPADLQKLIGTFHGKWTMFGINDKGDVVKRMAWTDTITCANPQTSDDKVFVTTISEMAIEGSTTKRKWEGKEGYFLNKDKSLGSYFIESRGQVQKMVKLNDTTWTYVSPAASQELASLGFPAGATGEHVLVKVVTKENSVETHRISRVTTVSWKKDGQEHWLQFVSLQGYHKKQ